MNYPPIYYEIYLLLLIFVVIYAHQKGRSKLFWGFLGFLNPMIAGIILLILKNKKNEA